MTKIPIFLFCDPKGNDSEAYIITPKLDGPYEVQHQYGCVGCQQFTVVGDIEPITDTELATKLTHLLDCDYDDIETIERSTGFQVDSVWGEGLMRLTDGRYVAVNNCD